MYNTFVNKDTKQMGRHKAVMDQGNVNNSKGIVIIMYCWVSNRNRCNIYKNDTTKRRKGQYSYKEVTFL